MSEHDCKGIDCIKCYELKDDEEYHLRCPDCYGPLQILFPEGWFCTGAELTLTDDGKPNEILITEVEEWDSHGNKSSGVITCVKGCLDEFTGIDRMSDARWGQGSIFDENYLCTTQSSYRQPQEKVSLIGVRNKPQSEPTGKEGLRELFLRGVQGLIGLDGFLHVLEVASAINEGATNTAILTGIHACIFFAAAYFIGHDHTHHRKEANE